MGPVGERRKGPSAAGNTRGRARGGGRRSGDGKSRRRGAERDEVEPSGGGNTRAFPGRDEARTERAGNTRAFPGRDEAGTEPKKQPSASGESRRGGGESRAFPNGSEARAGRAERFRTAPKRGRGEPSVSERLRSEGGESRAFPNGSEAGAETPEARPGKMEAPGSDPTCGLCGAAASPYTCPRCNRRLCSLRCYRGHGACAEAFYREQVLQALRSERGSPRGPPGLGSALAGPHQLREAGDAAGRAGRALWDSLSEAERAEFQRLLRTGEAAKLLPAWRPWWWRRGKRQNEREDPAASPPPAVPTSIPALSSFRAAPPSPLLRFQLPNVLFGYVFALALHGGDESLLPELPAAAVDVSAALRTRRAFSSTAQALRAARADAAAAGYPLCPLGDAGVVLEVAELLEGRGVMGNYGNGGGGRGVMENCGNGGGGGRGVMEDYGNGSGGERGVEEDYGNGGGGGRGVMEDYGNGGGGGRGVMEDYGNGGGGGRGVMENCGNGSGGGHGVMENYGNGSGGGCGVEESYGNGGGGERGVMEGYGNGGGGGRVDQESYGNGAVLAALAHLERLLRRGGRAPGAPRGRGFEAARRKCRFLLSWSREEPPRTMRDMGREARALHRELLKENGGLLSVNESGSAQPELVSVNESAMGLVNESRGRRLIEELD